MISSKLSGQEIGNIVLFAILMSLSMGVLSWIVGKLIRLERKDLAAVALTTMFTNAGNYGLAVVLFAFGEEALAFAGIYFVTNALMAYSVGAVVASLGTKSLAVSLKSLLKVPALYAMVLGLTMASFGWTLPVPVGRAVNLLADASIPVLMVVLGMQLHAVQWQGSQKPIIAASSLRLLVGPILAIALSGLMGLSGPARQAGILEASMPTAILTSVLATEYNLQPHLVTAVVFVTTILSPLTLTPLLAILGG